MTEIKKKRGRPLLGANIALTDQVVVRLTRNEKITYEAKAKEKSLSLSEFIRNILKSVTE